MGRRYRRVALDHPEQHLDPLLELGVDAARHVGRLELDLDVRRHALVLNHPLAVGRVDAVVRAGQAAAVDERQEHGNAHQPAPCAGADDRPHPLLPELPGQHVAAGARLAVGEQREVGAIRVNRLDLVLRVAPGPVGQRLLGEPLQEDVGVEATAVEASVHQQPLLAGLRVVVLGELDRRSDVGVGQVQVADAAVRRLLDPAAVALHPVEVAQGALAGERRHDRLDLAAAAEQRQPHLLAGEALESGIDLAVGGDFPAVDRHQVIAFADVDARPHQRRHDPARPVGHAQDPLDHPTPGGSIERPVGPQQADVDPLGAPPAVADVDVGVRGGELADQLADDEAQILGAGRALHQRPVLRAHGRPVEAVHAGLVVEVAFQAPGVVEDLPPLRPRVELHHEVVEIDDLTPGRRRRRRSRRGVAALPAVPAVRVRDAHRVAAPPHQVLAVDGQRVLFDLRNHGLELAVLEVEGVQGPRRQRTVLEAVEIALVAVEKIDGVGSDRQVAVVGGRHRQRLDPIGDAFEIDRDPARRIGWRGLAVGVLRRHDLVGERRQQRLAVRAQSERVDAGRVLVDHLPLEVAEGGVEAAVGDEQQVLAVAAENRTEVVEDPARDVAGDAVVERVEVDAGDVIEADLRVGQPARVGRPRVVGDGLGLEPDVHRLDLGPVHRLEPPARHVDDVQAQGLVGEGDLGAVGRPARGVRPAAIAAGEGPRLAGAQRIGDEELVLAPGIGEVRDAGAVRGPCGTAVAGARAAGQVARRTVLGGHGEDLAAGRNQGAAACGRDVDVGDEIGDGLAVGPGLARRRRDLDRNPRARTGCRVEEPQVARHLVDDAVPALARPPDVVVGVAGDLGLLSTGEIVAPDVERTAAVGREVDGVADPHGQPVRAAIVGEPQVLAGCEVVEPQVLRHAAVVALPGAVLAGDPVVGDLRAVGRERAAAGLVQRQLLEARAVGCDQEQAVEAGVRVPSGAEQDLGGHRVPAHNLVRVRVERQPPQL